jgi:uncharacterized protein YwgA
MKRRQRQAVLLKLLQELHDKGILCEYRTLQTVVYPLQEEKRVPLKFPFIPYKGSPYSFELRDEITAMLADGLIILHSQPYPNSPVLVVTEDGERLMSRYPKTLSKHNDAIKEGYKKTKKA